MQLCVYTNIGTYTYLCTYIRMLANMANSKLHANIHDENCNNECYALHIYNTYYHTSPLPGVVIITTPASPLPIELVATTENV